jgi:hypothetical protein
LIVLIINARNINITNPLLKANVSVVRIVDCQRIAAPAFDRSDQINQISRGISVPPRGAGQTEQKAISLRCRKIRTLGTKGLAISKAVLRQRSQAQNLPEERYMEKRNEGGECSAVFDRFD